MLISHCHVNPAIQRFADGRHPRGLVDAVVA